ncbi:unnamed protein product, partial [Allacma fusca]
LACCGLVEELWISSERSFMSHCILEIFEPERAEEFLAKKLATRKKCPFETTSNDDINFRNSSSSNNNNTTNVTNSQEANETHKKCFQLFGLTDPSTWEVYEFSYPEGLVFIKNPFTSEGQRYWIAKCLSDYPKDPHVTNMENLRRRHPETAKDTPALSPENDREQFYKELRWITFGYHHDWDTKVYTEDNQCEFPPDLAELTKYLSLVLGYEGFNAEAAIANYYHLDSTLSGHVDKSEKNQFAPLFSLSFGQTALFLIGGETKEETPLGVYLKSGDIAVMAGPSRLSYHGVPKILPCETQPWNFTGSKNDCTSTTEKVPDTSNLPKKIKLDEASSNTKICSLCEFIQYSKFKKSSMDVSSVMNRWSDFHGSYIAKSRINLNVRQVLLPGQKSLNDEIDVDLEGKVAADPSQGFSELLLLTPRMNKNGYAVYTDQRI